MVWPMTLRNIRVRFRVTVNFEVWVRKMSMRIISERSKKTMGIINDNILNRNICPFSNLNNREWKVTQW